MKITKYDLIEALRLLAQQVKTSSKKDELIMQLNNVYEKNIEKLLTVININIYYIIEKLVQADENGIDVDEKYQYEVYFLINTLIIEEPEDCEEKLRIKFRDGMKEKCKRLISKKNEELLKKNQEIVDLIINISYAYGVIRVFECMSMLYELLEEEFDVEYIYDLLCFQIELRRDVLILDNDKELFLMNHLVKYPENIIEEREENKLYYKKYSLDELKKIKFEKLLNCKEAKDFIKFLEKRKVHFASGLVSVTINKIMNMCEFDFDEFEQLIQVVNIQNIDEANEYLQLIMNLYNSIPHYSLYGFSPNELMELKIKGVKEKENRKKQKVGRRRQIIMGNS